MMMSTKNLATCTIAMAATLATGTNAQDGNAPDCSAEQNACMAAAECLAIMMSSMGSCGDPPCQANYGADGQTNGTCSGGADSCTFVAGSTPSELMAALMANTEGAVYMACQMGGAAGAQDETPCANDADRVETTVFAACMGDETCLGILMSDAMQTDEGANPSQAQVYDSGWCVNPLKHQT